MFHVDESEESIPSKYPYYPSNLLIKYNHNQSANSIFLPCRENAVKIHIETQKIPNSYSNGKQQEQYHSVSVAVPGCFGNQCSIIRLNI